MKFLVLFTILALVFSATSATIQKQPQVGNAACDMCEYLVHTAEDLVFQNMSNTQVTRYLQTACKILPTKYAGLCEVMVEQYASQIIKKVLEFETPAVVCQQIQICGGQKEVEPIVKTPAVESVQNLGHHHHHHHFNPLKKFECKACDYAVKHIESHVMRGEAIHDIERAVDLECDRFDIHEAIHICKKVVHESINKIVEHLLKHESPERVCKEQVHMC
ncbi:saposin A [Cavenderia fasciculata]|uniref:Saposin A n=1 Tax=Cavenderia fasciculata TaxID=261658 RepID=F4PW79_CACFS|nr:saposin A [Cavenderia fasciculata]EGG20243.1 saposin A [Cavenderia fasciculata]|eukprot:XP_004367226.1 saposin A [Cavenderia fasciculata]